MTAAAQVVHPALSPFPAWPAAQPLAAARLTDRQRLALLLEAAGLLSLLEHAGWGLPRGWGEVRVAAGGRLVLGPHAASPGRSPRPSQDLLRELLLRSFGIDLLDAGGAASWEIAEGGSHRDGSSGSVAGRGEARRAARVLLVHWWQPLVPLPADLAVDQILASAPFLWGAAFALARQALAGELVDAGGTATLWVAGSGASRARLLAGCADRVELAARLGGIGGLGGQDASGWWQARETPPTELDTAMPAGEAPPAGRASTSGSPRHWLTLAAAASRTPPATEPERLRHAAALVGLGRFEAALEALAPCRSPAARLQRARCQLQLGRLGAARAILRRLEAIPLPAAEAIEASEAALRVFANSGDPDRLPRWVDRARAAARSGPPARLARAALVAALAAWDRQEPAAMDLHLEAARAALFPGGASSAPAPPVAAGGGPAGGPGEPREPADAVETVPAPEPPPEPEDAAETMQAVWRFHQVCGLRAMAMGDGPAMVGHLGRALRHGRRALARHEAAGLWNDLGIGRVQAGDLAAAEQAFLHAQRLFSCCDGPRRATLALLNLAEVRLRRGRVTGVREILERSTVENRRSGNLRGLTQDAELWARRELLLGRPAEAAALCREAIDRLDRRGLSWRRDVLAVLLARALGWLDHQAEAAAELARVTPEALAELEPEERPALWAHAGERQLAVRAAAVLESPAASLWPPVLAGKAVPTTAWLGLTAIEPYRAARLVFDLERCAAVPLAAPAEWRRSAIATFRRLGAATMADWLEARDAAPWQALAAYASHPTGDLPAIAALLRQAGDPGARLFWNPSGKPLENLDAEKPEALASVRLAADLPGGRLELRCNQLSPALSACFALAVRDLATLTPAAPSTPSTPSTPDTRLAGASAAIRNAVTRLARIAAVDIPVLIQGETGTGKELAAREIHRTSARAGGPYLALNCAALGESLLLADLFGHVRGAFTGADRDRAGVFETARGGTVLLDEIGDLPLAAQSLLLRVLQEGEVRRLGESMPRRVDVRVLAATHRDLQQAVAAGAFRQDLYYRLKVGAIELPPLRERGDDLLELADRCLARQPFQPPPRLAAAARDALRSHTWPGNVRELENVLRLAAALAGGGVIGPQHLELPAAVPAAGPVTLSYHREIEALRRRLLTEALAAVGGHHAAAARRLGISRQALSYLVRQLGLS